MITSNRRRLWGATSFMSKRWWVQRSSMGPSGPWLLRSPITATTCLPLVLAAPAGRSGPARAPARLQAHTARRSRWCHRTPGSLGCRRRSTAPVSTAMGKLRLPSITTPAKVDGEAAAPGVPLGVVEPQALEHRPRPVEQVDAQGDVGDDVDGRAPRPLEAGDQVAVDVAPHEIGVDRPPGQVGQVPDQEQQDHHAGQAHRAAGGVGGLPVPPGDIAALGVGPPVHQREAGGGVDVEHEGQAQADAEQPQQPGAGQQRHEQLAQELAVVVVVLGAEVELEVPEHVGEHVGHERDAGQRHHPLLADRRAIELDRPRCRSAGVAVHGGDGGPLHGLHRSISLRDTPEPNLA